MDPAVLLPSELIRELRRLEMRLGKPVRVRLVRFSDNQQPFCTLREIPFGYELLCHDPNPGYFWHIDALRRFLQEMNKGEKNR